MRIISLLPSATEILFDLGLGDSVVGVTFECDFPPEAKSKRIVSTSALEEGLTPAQIDAVVKERMAAGEDLYRLDQGAFAELEPDIVVTQDLCAVCAVDLSEVDEALSFLGCSAEVVSLDPMTLDEVIASIGTVGAATSTQVQAQELIDQLQTRLGKLRTTTAELPQRSVLALEWIEPAFTAGHWVPDMISAAGGSCELSFPGAHSQGVEWETIQTATAEVVLVSPCGFRLEGSAEQAQQLIEQNRLPAGAEVWALDADAHVVRPGPRLVEGAEIMASVLHPEVFGPPPETAARRIR